MSTRVLKWDDCHNVRDLGGYPTASGETTRWGALIRADNLCRLNDNGRSALVEFGIRTIIDLRTRGEIDAEPHPFGVVADGLPQYINLSLILENEESAAALDAAASLYDLYLAILTPSRGVLGEVLTTIAREEDVVLFHCNGGKDRTGVVAAVMLALAGVSDDVIADDYALTEKIMEPLYTRVMAGAEEASKEKLSWLLTTPRETMLNLLAWMREQDGSIEEFVKSCGVSGEDIAALKRRLL